MLPILEIIPKITSPLAVICFSFYVFYLYKRSDDSKKEKSLSVGDPSSQKMAAEKILNDYPDIRINTITDPIGAVEIARDIIDGKLKRHNKNANTLLIFSGIFAATFLLSSITSNNNILTDKISKDSNTKKAESWSELESIKHHYPYATLSIVQHIKIRDITIKGNYKKRIAEFRNFYTISATKDISSLEPVFEEQFLTNEAKIRPWPGTEVQEIESITDGRYWVKFDLKENEVKTLVTGADYIYSIPLNYTTSTSCFGDIINSTSQWMTCYPNSVDYIDKITIVIEADSIDISLPPVATYRKTKEGSIKKGEGSCKIFSSNNNCTLKATWENIYPGECVGFLINWKTP